MKTKSLLILSAVYFLSHCGGVCGKSFEIIFPRGENLEAEQEYLPVIGKYSGDGKGLKLTLNNSPVIIVKLEKDYVFNDKIKLNPGLNELKVINGADSQIINILYSEENKNKEKKYSKILVHSPVLENECSECHTREVKDKYPSVDVSKVICFNCHDSFEKDKFVHGPIGSGACTACHDPHGSVEAKFLREDKNKICYMCHEEEPIRTGHLANLKNSNKEECSFCHNSHGGKDKYFLKETK